MAELETQSDWISSDTAALDWFIRRREGNSVRERAAFERWLEADPANRRAYTSVEAMWERLHGAGELLLTEEEPELRSLLAAMDTHRKARSRRKTAAYVAGLICLFLAIGGVWLQRPHLLEDLRADDVTTRGERRMVTLPDGSTALLEADSALTVRFSAGDRRVVLLRGAAFFSVVRTGEPFEVEAAGGEERVLGTKFAVRLEGAGAAVTVAEGRVAVSIPGFAQATLTAGEQVSYGPSGMGQVMAVNLDKALAWKHGLLIFYDTPLQTVIEELGRYYHGRILILNNDLARQPVTGNFAAADPDAALASLQKVVGFRRYDLLGGLIILR